MDVVTVENISKVFKLYRNPFDRLKEALNPFSKDLHRKFAALKGIHVNVQQGESVGLVGVNGSGKSTLLQIIAGVLTPTDGQVKVHGRIAALLELGAGFNPQETGLENIRFQCALQGFPASEFPRLTEEILEFSEIGKFAQHPVKTYSSGMYVRLAFATSIMVEPDILIVDEALAVGDIKFQNKCLKKIRDFKDKGGTLLFVSHDANAVKGLCDRAYVLSQGEVVKEGRPDPVLKYYNNLVALGVGDEVPQQGDLTKRSGNGRIRTTGIRLLNSAGLPLDTFVSGEKVTLEVSIEAFDEVEAPTFGFSIHDRLGLEMFGVNTLHLEADTGILKKGDKRLLSYSLTLNLGINLYSVSVSCHAGDSHLIENYDWLNDALVFKVVTGSHRKFVGHCFLDTAVEIQDSI